MSGASDKGRDFEIRMARIARQKGIKAKRDKRSGAGEVYKADLALPGLSWHVEAKAHTRWDVHGWWRQAVNSARLAQHPLLLIDDGANGLAVLKWEDFCDLIKTVQEDSATITKLRTKERV